MLPLGQQLSARREEWQRQADTVLLPMLSSPSAWIIVERTKWNSSLNEKENFEKKHKSQNCCCCLEFAWMDPSGKTMIQLNVLFSQLSHSEESPKLFKGSSGECHTTVVKYSSCLITLKTHICFFTSCINSELCQIIPVRLDELQIILWPTS